MVKIDKNGRRATNLSLNKDLVEQAVGQAQK